MIRANAKGGSGGRGYEPGKRQHNINRRYKRCGVLDLHLCVLLPVYGGDMTKTDKTLMIAWIFCLAVILASCATAPLDHEYTIEMPKVVVHVLPFDSPFWKNHRCDGMASTANEIWVKGKWVDGKILIEDHVYNHEFLHLIGFRNKDFWNPDKYTGWF